MQPLPLPQILNMQAPTAPMPVPQHERITETEGSPNDSGSGGNFNIADKDDAAKNNLKDFHQISLQQFNFI